MSALRRLAAVPAAVVATVLLAGSALGAQPIHTVFDVDDTITFAETPCGFPISRTVQGTIRESVFTDGDGNPVRIVTTAANFTMTFSNPLNGKSTSSIGPAAGHVTFNDDGSRTLTLTGLLGFVLEPGAGILVIDAGRIVIHFPVAGDPVELGAVGNLQMGPFPALCEVLA